MLSWQHHGNIAAITQADVRLPGGMWSMLVNVDGEPGALSPVWRLPTPARATLEQSPCRPQSETQGWPASPVSGETLLNESRCPFRKSYTNALPLGSPRSSVASAAGLEPGAPRITLTLENWQWIYETDI